MANRSNWREWRNALLVTHIMTLDEFIEEEDRAARGEDDAASRLKPIPVLLKAGETPTMYEQTFEEWIRRRNTAVGMLRSKPEVERRFRMDFAESRAWELRRQRVALTSGSAMNEFKGSDGAGGVHRAHCGWSRTREELLDSQVMLPTEFLKATEAYGINGSMNRGQLQPIPVVLRPNESRARYEVNFERWLSTKAKTLAELQDNPEEERRYRQCFAYARAMTSRKGDAPDLPSSQWWCNRSSVNGRKRSAPIEARKRKLQRSGANDSKYGGGGKGKHQRLGFRGDGEGQERRLVEDGVRELEHHFAQVYEAAMAELEKTSWSCSSVSPGTSSYAPETPQSNPYSDVEEELPDDALVRLDPTGSSAIVSGKSPTASQEFYPGSTKPPLQLDIDANSFESDYHPATQSDICHTAVEVLSMVEQALPGPEVKAQVSEYVRMTEQIVLNETALKDFFVYIQQQTAYDETEVSENLGEIRELEASINKEKCRRDALLVALIGREWSGRQEELDRLVLLLNGDEGVDASHEKLAALYSKLEQNEELVAALQSTLNSRLVSARAHGDEFPELQGASSNLVFALSERCLLEDERQVLCVDLLRSNCEIRTAVMSFH